MRVCIHNVYEQSKGSIESLITVRKFSLERLKIDLND